MLFVTAALLCVSFVQPACARGAEKPSPEIAALIRQLGSASAQRREAAWRRLLEIGPRCVPALKEARRHRDLEVATRARELLETFDHLLLAGATVTLAAEPAQVRWNQPFDLLVKIQNETPVACHVPFSPKLANLFGLSSVARQTGMVLDAADYLTVTGPDGAPIEPHTFDVADDAAVQRVVELRAEGLAYDRLAAGATKTFRLPAFNRGRARYRMLAAGTYRAQLVYEPDWDDSWLAERRIGRIESNVLEVQILDDAPAIVRAAGPYLHLTIEKQGRTLIGRLTNAYDLPVYVNLNVNGDSPLHARVQWIIQAGGHRLEVPLAGSSRFDPGKLHELEPGSTVELARSELAEILSGPAVRTLPPADRPTAKLRYVSLLSRSSLPHLSPKLGPQEQQAAASLPHYLIAGHFESEPMVIAPP